MGGSRGEAPPAPEHGTSTAQLHRRARGPQWPGVNTNPTGDHRIPNQGGQSRGGGAHWLLRDTVAAKKPLSIRAPPLLCPCVQVEAVLQEAPFSPPPHRPAGTRRDPQAAETAARDAAVAFRDQSPLFRSLLLLGKWEDPKRSRKRENCLRAQSSKNGLST